jgi:hypothetical protein
VYHEKWYGGFLCDNNENTGDYSGASGDPNNGKPQNFPLSDLVGTEIK